MKTTFVATITALFLAVALAGTLEAQDKVALGVTGSAGLANLTGDIAGTKSTLSIGAGGLLRFSPSPRFSVQPELQLVLKGAADNDSDSKVKLTYLEFPILALYRPPATGTVSPCFFAGPALGLLLSAKEGDDDIKDLVESTDFGLVFGAGIDVKTKGTGIVNLSGRYTLGITDIEKEFDDYAVKNGAFLITVSYLFPLKP